MKTNQVFAFEVNVSGTDWQRVINAQTSGQAKSEYFHELQDPWPEVPFTALRCRKLGPAQTSADFRRCAANRGVKFECGDRVRVGEATGTIVGHNSSANFDVLFDNDSLKYPGLRLNVHPNSIVAS